MKLSPGYHSRCAIVAAKSCSNTMTTNVSIAINSTSHPVQAGFSRDGGEVGVEALRVGAVVAKGTNASGVGLWESMLGCGSNCGLSGEAKTDFFLSGNRELL